MDVGVVRCKITVQASVTFTTVMYGRCLKGWRLDTHRLSLQTAFDTQVAKSLYLLYTVEHDEPEQPAHKRCMVFEALHFHSLQRNTQGSSKKTKKKRKNKMVAHTLSSVSDDVRLESYSSRKALFERSKHIRSKANGANTFAGQPHKKPSPLWLVSMPTLLWFVNRLEYVLDMSRRSRWGLQTTVAMVTRPLVRPNGAFLALSGVENESLRHRPWHTKGKG